MLGDVLILGDVLQANDAVKMSEQALRRRVVMGILKLDQNKVELQTPIF